MAQEQPTGESVLGALRSAVPGLADGLDAERSRDEWLALVSTCQSLMNGLAAVQERAVAEVARREQVWEEDGTLGERVHPSGWVAIDAADLVAPALGCSHAQARRRVDQAVRVAAARVPAEVGGDERPVPSGLGRLHEAMADGTLDGYRAGVVAFELEEAPPDVAEGVLDALSPHLHEEAAVLRRRCRRILARISPDLLRQRAVRARAATGLRRWAAEPGVDAWYGTFPSEEAAVAWSAVDRRAHELVAAGVCTSLEQARGKALTDLVTGQATVDVQVSVAVPVGPVDAGAPEAPGQAAASERRSEPGERLARRQEPTAARDGNLVQVQGARPGEPVLVPVGWLREHAGDGSFHRVPCDPGTGAAVDVGNTLCTSAYRPSARLGALVRERDGRCRFPGCSVSARFCDLDHVRPWPGGSTSAVNLLCLCRRHHRIKQLPGWSVRLSPDGVATWTSPNGRVRTTEPLDALDVLVLADVVRSAPATTPLTAPPAPRTPMWSCAEVRLGLLLDHDEARRAQHRRCAAAAARRPVPARRQLAAAHDPPPF